MMRYLILVALMLCLPVRGEAWQVVGEGTWTPSALYSGGAFGMWYDPSDLSTLFQDAAGTIPVTTTGQSVCRVNDKSGNGVHLSQATETKCPTLQSDSGKNYLDFDGGDVLSVVVNLSSYNKVSSIVGISTTSTSVQVVSEYTTTGASIEGGFYTSAINDPASGRVSIACFTDNVDAVAPSATVFASGKSVITSTIDLDYDISTDKMKLYRNGEPVTVISTADPGLAGTGFANSTFFIGGRGSTPTLGVVGRIYSYIATLSILSADARSSAEVWTNAKTGAY